MLNNNHLLVKCITLVYHESHLVNKSGTTASLIEQALEHIKFPEITTGIDVQREMLKNLTSTIKKYCKDLSTPISLPALQQQLLIDCIEDRTIVDAVIAGISNELEDSQRQFFCSSIRKEISGFLRDQEARELLFTYANNLRHNPGSIESVSDYLTELTGKLEPYVNGGGIEDDPGIVTSVSSDDSQKLIEIFNEVKNRDKGLTGFRFGFKGLNRFYKGRLETGKLVTLGALQHQHKTGMSLAMFRHAFMYNLPVVKEWLVQPDLPLPEAEPGEDPIDPEKGWNGIPLTYTEDEADFFYDEFIMKEAPYRMKDGKDPFKGGTPKRRPALLRISAEDEMIDNLEQLYKNIYFNVYKEMPDMKLVTKVEIQEFVSSEISRNGWYVEFLRINPSEWTYRSIIQRVIDMESKGLDVQMVMIDYLAMIPTTGCTDGHAGYALRDMFRRLRNFFSARDILLYTPHQLSTDAVRQFRQGTEDFVRQLPNKNLYADSTQIAQEIDLELFCHIEIINGVSWLTVQRGKYRSPKVVDENDKYIALPFHPEGGLQDDLIGPELGRKAPGSTVNSQGIEEAPFWA